MIQYIAKNVINMHKFPSSHRSIKSLHLVSLFSCVVVSVGGRNWTLKSRKKALRKVLKKVLKEKSSFLGALKSTQKSALNKKCSKKLSKKCSKAVICSKKGSKNCVAQKRNPKKWAAQKRNNFTQKRTLKSDLLKKVGLKKIGIGKKDLIKEWQCVFQFSHNSFHPISCFLGGTVEIGQHSRDEASLIGDSTYGRFQKPMSRVPPPLKIQKNSFILDFNCQPLRRVPICFVSVGPYGPRGV